MHCRGAWINSMKIVSIVNHKGGVGKTTFTGCLGQALGLSGYRVLLIDNDGQHNLSSLVGTGICSPNLRDVYKAGDNEAAATFLKSVRKTGIGNVHIVTSSSGLSEGDVKDISYMQRCLAACGLGRFYDFVLIDNAPGLGMLQMAAVHASNEIFVPTELRQFAVDGLAEMEKILKETYPSAPPITRIIPNFYRATKRQNTFIAALHRLFPGRVTQTAIPMDSVFDELVTEGKTLFLHRLYSKGAAYYLKIMHELFDLDERKVWETMLEKRRKRMSDEARERYFARREEARANRERQESP
ncbi:MAG: AAA family ATPase [Chitinivibrionales bacterium]|nr:AAA family ATPase [Chitinivibrionales bacterium]MBD3358730.1 AAA family ATPase [Chitinivibrionales bacterium]